jgi:hypothetical protein
MPVLDPSQKMHHFKKHWPDDLQNDVQGNIEKWVCYNEVAKKDTT